MKHRFVFALACASMLSAAAVTAVSCKSNTITQNNNVEDFESFQTATMKPDQEFNLLGPDNSLVHAPPGAVDKSIDVVIGKMKGGFPKFPDGWIPTGGIYAFEPHKQTFAQPVTIRVPYKAPADGAGVRLVTAEPDGAWTPVDYADGARLGATVDKLSGVFALVRDAKHFSYYAVVTGQNVPPDTTIRDAGPDAAPDAPPDSRPEAGPPPGPTLFALGKSGLYRWSLSPVAITPGNADAGTDASADGGVGEGGVLAISYDGGTPISVAMGNANGTYTLFADGLTDPDAGIGAVAAIGDPFGAFTLSGGFAPANPGVMGFFRGEIWMSIGNPANIATYSALGAKTWDGTVANMTTNAAGYGGIAYDPATQTVYLTVQGPDAVQRWLVSGNAGGPKNAVKQTPDITDQMLQQPGHIAVTPWNELLVVSNFTRQINRFDLTNLTNKGFYSSQNFGMAEGTPFTVYRGAGGVDEIFVVDSETGAVSRFAFTDATHNTVVRVGAPLATGGDMIYSLIVSP